MTRKLTVKFPAALDYDRRPHAIGYSVEVHVSPYDKYAIARLSIYGKLAEGGYSDERWRKVATITAQCTRLEDDDHRDAPKSHYALRYGKGGSVWTQTDMQTSFSKWYAVRLTLDDGNDYYTDSVAGDCARAAVVSQVWEKVDATVDQKNLAYKYDDGLTHIVAALNLLGAQSLESDAGGWTMVESFNLSNLK